MNTYDKLKEARDWFADPKHFCTDDFAQDANGNGLNYDLQSPNVARVCIQGAIARALGYEYGADLWDSGVGQRLESVAERHFDGFETAYVNNVLGHAAALRLFDLFLEEAHNDHPLHS